MPTPIDILSRTIRNDPVVSVMLTNERPVEVTPSQKSGVDQLFTSSGGGGSNASFDSFLALLRSGVAGQEQKEEAVPASSFLSLLLQFLKSGGLQ